MTCEWCPVIDLSALNGFITLTRFCMEMMSLVLGVDSSRRRYVRDWPQGHILPDSHLSRHYVFCSSLSPSLSTSSSFLFWPFISSPDLHQGVQPDFGVGSQKGNLTPILPGRLVSCCGVGSSPSASSGATLPALSDWEKSDLEPSSRAQYFGMLIDTIRERALWADSRIVRFWDLADNFLLLTSPPAKMWQPTQGHLLVHKQVSQENHWITRQNELVHWVCNAATHTIKNTKVSNPRLNNRKLR